jgi:hypothetical protein
MRAEKYSRSLDELETDLIVVTLYENERPPRGVSGLIDWRLHGFLSRQIIAGRIRGSSEECVLIPLNKKFPARRLLVVGLGDPGRFDLTKARHAAYKIGKTISNLGVHDVAVSFPIARDERSEGETERCAVSAMEQAELSRDVYLRWLDPSIVEH